MDTLFEANVASERGSNRYAVSFQNDTYVFTPGDGSNPFHLRREHDEWQYDGDVSQDTANQAMGLLDDYLLAQH